LSPPPNVAAFLEECRLRVDAALEGILPAEATVPERLHRALRYPVFAGGKRLRPALLLAANQACGGDPEAALPAAAAIELIHTYSLVHDDLPAMDDDALRRGRATCHVAFDEATAILVGDALLTLAFETLATLAAVPPAIRAQVASEIAAAAGSRGMVAGQALDLEAEGEAIDGARLEQIHRLKTGALLRAAVTSGALLAGAPAAEVEALRGFGEAAGLAFQIVDDLLDVEGTSAAIGKTAGKDARSGKATFPAVWGIPASRARAAQAAARAQASLAPFGERGDLLRALADFVIARDR
jgi:geranylgeranyl pyrophosphate synthase